MADKYIYAVARIRALEMTLMSQVGAAMQKEALKQEISTRMNDLVRIERNPVLRAVPLEPFIL